MRPPIYRIAREQHNVRLAGIDAPERRQAFGDRSRQSLAELVFRRRVTLNWHKKDRYGRLVGVVRVDGLDAGLHQLRAGMAWHYMQYQSEQSKADQEEYSHSEAEARLARRGLWRDPLPEAPWEFRRAQSRSQR
jgi:endonuclease YncB( thermonuclease family)